MLASFASSSRQHRSDDHTYEQLPSTPSLSTRPASPGLFSPGSSFTTPPPASSSLSGSLSSSSRDVEKRPTSPPFASTSIPRSRTLKGFFLSRGLTRLLVFAALTLVVLSITHLGSATPSDVDLPSDTDTSTLPGSETGSADESSRTWSWPSLWPSWKEDGQALWKGGLAGCRNWDPEADQADDPPKCERAKLYRQVQRVLAREESSGGHPTYPFNRKANIATLNLLLKCYLPKSHPDARDCLDRPVVINAWYWAGAALNGVSSGEAVWQAAVVKTFKEQGVHTLYFGPYENWIVVAEMMPDVYRYIWADNYETISCISDPRCIAPEHYVPPRDTPDLSADVPEDELGSVPVYRLLSVDYWGAQPEGIMRSQALWGVPHKDEWTWHPLGNRWVITPWPTPGHQHLAYSIEDHCLKQPFMPASEKTDNVLILAKESKYFYMKRAVPPEHLTQLSATYPLTTAARERAGSPFPEGVSDAGFQTDRNAYEALVARSKVMLGIGFPFISPSVYTALCQGTPVVMPHSSREHQYAGVNLEFDPNGWEMYAQRYQHGPAAALGPPYVYSFFYNNYTQLEHAVALAHSTPIERYIPENMQTPFVREKAREFLARDLEAEMLAYKTQHGGEIPPIEGYIWEKCKGRKKCKKAIPEGRKRFEEIPERRP